jgi:hypothetical protein
MPSEKQCFLPNEGKRMNILPHPSLYAHEDALTRPHPCHSTAWRLCRNYVCELPVHGKCTKIRNSLACPRNPERHRMPA